MLHFGVESAYILFDFILNTLYYLFQKNLNMFLKGNVSMNVLFVSAYDNTVRQQWLFSECGRRHNFRQMKTRLNISSSAREIIELRPDVIFMSYDTGSADFNGADLALALKRVNEDLIIIENTSTNMDDFNRNGRGIDLVYNALEDPMWLSRIINSIERGAFRHAV